jgi:isopenicillin N synthase-like dioxygenase
MPSAVERPSEETLEVPTIDISPYLSDPTSPAADDIISRIHSACVTTGFFQIVGHSVTRELQTRTFDAAKKFFALDFEEKKKLDAKLMIGHRGYDVLGTQSYEDGVMPDLKEVIYFPFHHNFHAIDL